MPKSFPSPRFISSTLLGLALFAPMRAQLEYTTPYSFTTLAGATNIGSADGAGSNARFNGPTGIASDPSGNLYIADAGNNSIRKVTPAGTVTTLAGSAGNGGSADGTDTAARFQSPSSVAIDAAGNLYVADSDNHTIRKITPSGAVSTLAGLAGTSGSTDGTGSAARFDYPFGIAVDPSGNVYVADTLNSTIRKITPAGVVTTLAGNAASSGHADGTGPAAKFSYPLGVTVDASGHVYVADTYNQLIRKITPDGVVTTLAGSLDGKGHNDGTGATAQFFYPYAMTVSPAGTLYVADTFSSTIRQITATGVVTTLAGTALAPGGADGTGAAAKFSFPIGIATDSTGNVYVTDTGNATIRKISSGALVTTLAGINRESTTGSSDGTGPAARFSQMEGAVVGPTGDLFVSDTYNHTIRKITPTGIVTTIAGNAGTPGRSDGTGTAASFQYPSGLATDTSGNLYVADSDNHLIRKITPDGIVSTVAGSTRFYYPYGICTDTQGNLFVADTGNSTVRKIAADGTVTNLAGTAGTTGSTDGTGSAALFYFPRAVVADVAGNLYVADTGNATIRKITPSGVVSTHAGLAETIDSIDGSGSAARFDSPASLTIDAAGNLYVGDLQSHLIRKITPAGVVSTIAGQPDELGSADGTGRKALFASPSALALDKTGRLYVASSTTIRRGIQASLPVFTTQPVSQSVKVGDPAAFSGIANGLPDPTYQWMLNGVVVAGATGSSLSINNAQAANAGDYTLVATNDLGSVTSTKATLTVNAVASPPSTGGGSTSGGGGGGGAPSVWFVSALLILGWVRFLRSANGD